MNSDESAHELLGGPVGHTTAQLLRSAAGGDQDLLHELVDAGISLGELVFHDGLWHWGGTPSSAGARLTALIESHAGCLASGQLEALDLLTRGPAEPHAAVARARHGGEDDIRLTPREKDVLALLGTDLTATAIARRLGTSTSTVTKHQENLYRKFGTSNRVGTVLLALRLGLLHPHG